MLWKALLTGSAFQTFVSSQSQINLAAGRLLTININLGKKKKKGNIKERRYREFEKFRATITGATRFLTSNTFLRDRYLKDSKKQRLGV